MATSSNFTLFTNDSGSAGGPTSYVQDEFDDVTLAATNNTSLTSNASTNPWNLNWANTDVTQFGVKTLLIKDFVLIQDRSKWISNKPTYQVIWNETFPAVQGYVMGDVQLQTAAFDQKAVAVNSIGDGFGIMGMIRRVQFIVNDSTNSTATGQVVVDGVNGNTITFNNLSVDASSTRNSKFSAFVHAATNASYDLHHYQLLCNQSSRLQIVGVVVYFENTNVTVDQLPGITYVNKSRINTVTGASFPIALGSSLGGVATIYKTQNNSYSYSAQGASFIQSVGVGTNGTGTVNVSTGTGSSFPVGSGVIGSFGTSMYVGQVTAVSTDALTVTPNLYIGVSGLFYKTWQVGPTYAINASLFTLANTIGSTALGGLSNVYVDPLGNFSMFGSNFGITDMTTQLGINKSYSPYTRCLTWGGASGFFQVDGFFSAAEVEWVGSGAVSNGVLAATFSVNGVPAYSQNQGATSVFRQTIFTDAGPGWNSFNIAPSASFINMAISKINLYTRSKDNGVTYGLLSSLELLQTQTQRSAVNASLMTLGTYRRYHADQLYFQGHNVRTLGASFPGGVEYIGASSNSAMRLEFYGKAWSLLGTAAAGTTVALDGVGVASAFNNLQTTTEGFHTLTVTQASSMTTIIQAVDVVRTYGEMKNYQKYLPNVGLNQLVASPELPSEIRLQGGNNSGGGNNIVTWSSTLKNVGTMVFNSDSANGDSITITENGLYSIFHQDCYNAANVTFGPSINSNQLSTNPESVSAIIVVGLNNVANEPSSVTVPAIYLQKGDIIRAHQTLSTRSTNGSFGYFFITQIRKF